MLCNWSAGSWNWNEAYHLGWIQIHYLAGNRCEFLNFVKCKCSDLFPYVQMEVEFVTFKKFVFVLRTIVTRRLQYVSLNDGLVDMLNELWNRLIICDISITSITMTILELWTIFIGTSTTGLSQLFHNHTILCRPYCSCNLNIMPNTLSYLINKRQELHRANVR